MNMNLDISAHPFVFYFIGVGTAFVLSIIFTVVMYFTGDKEKEFSNKNALLRAGFQSLFSWLTAGILAVLIGIGILAVLAISIFGEPDPYDY